MTQSVSTFLMFAGKATAAIDLYTDVFPGFTVKTLDRFGPSETGKEGTVRRASIDFQGQSIIFFDSPIEHDFTFTPAISFFIDCDSDDELERVFRILSEDGEIFMPLGSYGFSAKFGWLADRFGVSWQINLPAEA